MLTILLYYNLVYTLIIALNIIFVLVVLAYFLVNLDKKNKILNDQYILGTWKREGHTADGDAWYFIYEFTEKEFKMTGHPEFNAFGKYQVIKEQEYLLHAKLYDIQGELSADKNILTIAIDKAKQMITIDGRDFNRVTS